MGVNVAAYYQRGDYDKRLPKLGKLRKDIGADVVLVTESNTYADGKDLNEAFGWSGVRVGTGNNPSFVLHGPSVPITRAIHWSDRMEWLASSQYDTVPNTTHNGATWALLRDKETGELWLFPVTHCQYKPTGPNKVRTKYDTEREAQFGATLEKAKIIAKNYEDVYKQKVHIVAGEDLNGARTDAYDGAGAAMKAHGFRDAERAKESGKDSAIIDRFAVGPDVAVRYYEARLAGDATDHKYFIYADVEAQ